MSRKTIGTLYAVSCMLELIAVASFLEKGLILAVLCAFAGWVIGMIAWIGTLVHCLVLWVNSPSHRPSLGSDPAVLLHYQWHVTQLTECRRPVPIRLKKR